jgi:hypothetical protein
VTLALTTCLAVTGCLPIPVRQTQSPELSGAVVSRDNVAAVGVNVCVEASGKRKPVCVRTDDEGRFQLRASKRTEMMWIGGDHVSKYSLTLAEGESPAVLGVWGHVINGGPIAIKLACNLSSPTADGLPRVHYCSETQRTR